MSTWFGNWFSKIQIYFPNHRSTWIVEEVLSSQIMNSFEPFEERVVLNCKRVKPSTGEEAIIKAHLQIPDEDGLPAEKLAKQASTSVNTIAEAELQFLTHLTEHGCSSTPQLLDTVKVQQPDSMCLPGGYILFILMEKLPGKMIMDYWDYDRETRDRIRAAFKASWSEVNEAGVSHCDQGRRNLLWHEKKNKCYILDFEDAKFIESPIKWVDAQFFFWELVGNHQGEKVL